MSVPVAARQSYAAADLLAQGLASQAFRSVVFFHQRMGHIDARSMHMSQVGAWGDRCTRFTKRASVQNASGTITTFFQESI